MKKKTLEKEMLLCHEDNWKIRLFPVLSFRHNEDNTSKLF